MNCVARASILSFFLVFTLVSIPRTVVAAADTPSVKLTPADNHIAVEIGGKPFTDYYFAATPDHYYTRPYFYPVLAGDGTPVTSDQTLADKSDKKHSDHPHHRSMWVAQGDVNGADHWTLTQGEKQPKQRHVKFEKAGEGDAIVEDLEWEGKDGSPILRERRTLRFFGYPDGSRGVDFILAFTPTDGEVTFGDTKEAGLCSVRMAHSISDQPTITTSTGATATNVKEETSVWGKPAEWCDESGRINDKEYGIAILDHPSNPRHPTTWHVRTYGLMAANPFGLSEFDKSLPKHSGDFVIVKGQTVTFKYRVVVHAGDAKSANVAEKYKAFAADH